MTKKKISISKNKIHERLHREPSYIHPKLKFIPNIILNLISFIVSLAVVATLIYLLIIYLADKFYNLK